MEGIKVYKPPERAAPMACFIDSLDPKLREKGKVLVRVIFTILPNGEILLLHAFIKRQSRDTMQALEQALGILAQARDHPELAVEYIVKEEMP